jgi:hypothetical protein
MLYQPHSLQSASLEEKLAVCNGCGSAKAKFDFVPDTVYGLSINPACNIHDWMYAKGKTNEDKLEADRVFLHNMLRLIEKKGGCLKSLRRRRAWKYYKAVQMFGGTAFWEDKN